MSVKSRGKGRKCEVLLAETATAIVITSNWDCYLEFCGYRVTNVLANGIQVTRTAREGALFVDFEQRGFGGVLVLRYRR